MSTDPSPYHWQKHKPGHLVPRHRLVQEVLTHLRRGAAVKVVGGRGMGKSVLLGEVEAALSTESHATAVLIPGPPDAATVPAAVADLATRLDLDANAYRRLDDLMDAVKGAGKRLIVLVDEADLYVTASEGFARAWFNKLEVLRKQHHPNFDVVIAGGLGLIYLERELGSGLLSRAEPCVIEPFSREELADLASPLAKDGRALDEACLATLGALSGGSPALATYGLECLWSETTPNPAALERGFIVFRERYGSFLRAVQDSVSQQGQLMSPWRVLEQIRGSAGSVPRAVLRNACARLPGERAAIDPEQALRLLMAAGLARTEGSLLADPVAARPVASILNLPDAPAASGDLLDRLVQDVITVLARLHRFGRDFYQKEKLLPEEAFSSIIAVSLNLLGWQHVDREPVQAAGYVDVKVRFMNRPQLGGHAIIENKLWNGASYNGGTQQQIDDYWRSDTRRGVAITIGTRAGEAWAADYEQGCLAGLPFQRETTPDDLVGWWKVIATEPDGTTRVTDHLLVAIPKRS